jgi:hypothetical protein
MFEIVRASTSRPGRPPPPPASEDARGTPILGPGPPESEPYARPRTRAKELGSAPARPVGTPLLAIAPV